VTTKLAHLLRRTLLAVTVAGLVLATAGPASAMPQVPEFWSDPEPVDGMHTVLVFIVLPIALFAVITLLVMLPSLLRRGGSASGTGASDQWFGGPAQGTAELPAPDTEESKAGGASGRW